MPIWAIVYLTLIAALSVWAIQDDLRSGEPRIRAVGDAVAMATLGFLFAGYFVTEVVAPLGRAAAPIFVLAFLWTGIAAHRELLEDDPDPELSARANLIIEHLGILIGVLIFAPLMAFAGAAAIRAW